MYEIDSAIRLNAGGYKLVGGYPENRIPYFRILNCFQLTLEAIYQLKKSII
ncbi:hypothetical protein SAMN05421510_10351 [Nitrosomonas ureae]|uniref:Uncharacterized protein n=1 Tax=Nitrosomonas ureae TaxID=44577 RepID=A0A1H9EUN9_9PROT|nr:hypothetical protein C8R28_102918 [Nitrosomonas ureae]PXX13415.1 hypothetical protein C8R27_12125 [Nitrosomonas ureae]SDU06581.1 hypothetical protein SAMN05216406_12124 [Nitrosomonas ureae]SEQ29466.1 hypothetical protein SAMN05421510_10351 [Nitrosomonas ureae]